MPGTQDAGDRSVLTRVLHDSLCPWRVLGERELHLVAYSSNPFGSGVRVRKQGAQGAEFKEALSLGFRQVSSAPHLPQSGPDSAPFLGFFLFQSQFSHLLVLPGDTS